MDRLTQRELCEIVEFLSHLHAVDTVDAFTRAVIHGLRQLVPSVVAGYNVINRECDHVDWLSEPDKITRFPQSQEILSRHIAEHPVLVHARRTGDEHWRSVSDFWTQQEFHRSALYNEFYRRFDVEYQIGVFFAHRASARMALAIGRDACDFSARERTRLEIIRPYVQRAYANAELIARLNQELDLFEHAFEALDTGLIAVGPYGRIRAATDGARALLTRHFGLAARRDNELPEPIGAWARRLIRDVEHPSELPSVTPSPLVLEGEETQLVARIIQRGAQCLLLLTERPTIPPLLVSRGLTRREIEVLEWVAEGKTNPEIAIILGLSRITVQHHLERVYRKLGVETRTAAAAYLTDWQALARADDSTRAVTTALTCSPSQRSSALPGVPPERHPGADTP